jgi:hypothetical protein
MYYQSGALVSMLLLSEATVRRSSDSEKMMITAMVLPPA